MNDNLVSVKNVSVEFDYQENFLSKKQKIQAVKNVSLEIKKKQKGRSSLTQNYLSFLAPIPLINNIKPDVAKHNQRPLA